ncbi:carbohydrate ABC transporter permease [Jannaschia rubra]|uniref:L-arabinose transport system permease protein AraQ n=1 Tax=Jannaschia rubra TaxID=282197 RepID=A0A0M6XV03_9RHOB|nr:carbohydrate ABC transporter permease [Jannaschia rubra]CTQ34071.1 L-arabinose transport system permease protein AraQ [Jannaschia rubra]SFG23807.1 maltose ABC transporter membrane protein /trehalose ABC transporter membrane protein /sucrose ABC transporter membrane protein [Jannaschia rubra]
MAVDDDGIAGAKSSLSLVTNLTVAILVILWLIPTIGLLVSSFRDRDAISQSGWWKAPFPTQQNFAVRTEGEFMPEGDGWVLTGNLFGPEGSGSIAAFGGLRSDPTAFAPGETGELVRGRTLTVEENGDYIYFDPADEAPTRNPTVYLASSVPPDFSLDNYDTILTSAGMDVAFINTLTVTIPATIIPILIAAFAAYALAWMDFPSRGAIIALVVGLLVVPLQLALVPMLKFHNAIGIGQSFYGIWFAHTGFGLPLAIYLLRNYMVGLPRDIIESAKVDGATDFQVFTRIVLPLSFPALASFAIFQFLWTWNDLLVAKVFLPSNSESWVMTVKIADDLLGSRGGDWGILAAAAFISIAVPLLVFFTMQRYLVRGLLAGSVK